MNRPEVTPLHEVDAAALLQFLHLAENLKNEVRHSFTSTGRRESVAEHTWRTAFLAFLLKPYFGADVNCGRVVEMLLVHDIAEAVVGDLPIFHSIEKTEKYELERKAVEDMSQRLPASVATALEERWHEFEDGSTREAKCARALDKLEAQLQHNEAAVGTWTPWEKLRVFGGLDGEVDVHPNLTVLKNAIIEEAIDKLRAAGDDIGRLETESRLENNGHGRG